MISKMWASDAEIVLKVSEEGDCLEGFAEALEKVN
jgi:hypothetical protein